MYRIDRHDAMSEIPSGGIEEQLEYCRRHLLAKLESSDRHARASDKPHLPYLLWVR